MIYFFIDGEVEIKITTIKVINNNDKIIAESEEIINDLLNNKIEIQCLAQVYEKK